MDTNQIDGFLSVLERREPENWDWKQYPKKGYWRAKYSGFLPPCTFYIEVGATFVYLHTTLNIHIWGECRLAVYRYLLRLNEEISGAKFGMAHNGQLTLMVERPVLALIFSEFETAVEVLLTYYQLHYADIQTVAQSVTVAQQITMYEQRARAEEATVKVQVV